MKKEREEEEHLLERLIERLEPLLAEEIEYLQAVQGGGLLGKEEQLEREKMQLLNRLKERMEECRELFALAFRSIKERSSGEERLQIAKEFSKLEELLQKPLEDLEREAETSSSFQELLELSPETMERFYGIGMQLFEEQRPHEAKALFFFLSLLDPLSFEHWFAFGICCDYLEEYEDASACYSMAVSIEPSDPDLRLATAEALLQADHLDEAALQLDELERLEGEGHREEIAELRRAIQSRRQV